jgi:hypothetical protein
MWRDRQAKLCETASIVSSQRANIGLRIMNNDHVILNVHIDAAGQEEKLADQLRALVDAPRSPGSRQVHVLRRFSSQSALDEHLAMPHFKAFLAYRAGRI